MCHNEESVNLGYELKHLSLLKNISKTIEKTSPASQKCLTAANLKPSPLLSLLPYQPIPLGLGCLTLPSSPSLAFVGKVDDY